MVVIGRYSGVLKQFLSIFPFHPNKENSFQWTLPDAPSQKCNRFVTYAIVT